VALSFVKRKVSLFQLDLSDLTENEKSLFNGTLDNKNFFLEIALFELKKSAQHHKTVLFIINKLFL